MQGATRTETDARIGRGNLREAQTGSAARAANQTVFISEKVSHPSLPTRLRPNNIFRIRKEKFSNTKNVASHQSLPVLVCKHDQTTYQRLFWERSEPSAKQPPCHSKTEEDDAHGACQDVKRLGRHAVEHRTASKPFGIRAIQHRAKSPTC